MSIMAVLAAAMVAGAQEAPPAKIGRTYTVQPGQTLWQIASLTVGDPTLWPALYLANRDQIKDPSRVYPGQELAIPNIDPERAAELRREGGALTTQ
ncbi:MAG: LysM peptidoglycan-binding domain-containing protein [Deltaproteobacteria bacterium]|nr:LysM peptidoglycan-binding domain-containing protein [Deltaproteobacteria bacterium]MBW2397391.1 LysM peptidoglycan-binding domain-containing protein [Deltaproteobacteria bacterium]